MEDIVKMNDDGGHCETATKVWGNGGYRKDE
jgi:hypothetical protein